MEYLEEKYPEVRLLPKDLAKRAKVGESILGGTADPAGHFVRQYFRFALGCGFEPWPGAMSQIFKFF